MAAIKEAVPIGFGVVFVSFCVCVFFLSVCYVFLLLALLIFICCLLVLLVLFVWVLGLGGSVIHLSPWIWAFRLIF